MLLSNKFVYRESNFVVCENKIFFLKNRKKKLFDKNLFVVEKFERLKKFKKINKTQHAVEIALFVNDFLFLRCFFLISCFDLINLLSTKFLKKFLTIFEIFDEFSRVF